MGGCDVRSTKQVAREIFRHTLASIDIPAVFSRKIECDHEQVLLPSGRVSRAGLSRTVVVAIGKAAHAMVEGLLAVFPSSGKIEGIVAAPTAPVVALPGIQYFLSGHPVPNADSLRAAEAILRLLRSCDANALVIFLLSGGGSSLVESPLDGETSLEEVQATHRALVTCGAPIDAINTVRRHLSAIKGGRLALAAASSRKITLAVTDVPAGKEAALASGPSLPDPSTISDVHRIIERYDLLERLPDRVRKWLVSGAMPETPKHDHAAFADAHFVLLLGMDDLFHAAHRAVEAHGYVCFCDNATDDWPVERAAEWLLEQLEEWRGENPGQKVAVVADGEVSSPVIGQGTGGRNSAFVLACVEKIAGRKITVMSAGTDGIDGNSPAAGAVADGETLKRASAIGLDPRRAFQDSDAYSFFAKLDDAIVTGPTGNNLRDLRVLLAEP